MLGLTENPTAAVDKGGRELGAVSRQSGDALARVVSACFAGGFALPAGIATTEEATARTPV